jgi:cobalt/nickel transport system permease protein
MHAPDGFLTAEIAITTGLVSLGVVGVSLRRAGAQLADRQVPLAGVAAAFVFAAQMLNFPVASGTTGHLLGGALVAILLGPAVGTLVVTVVVVVQALVFADGGLTSLGYNVLNMAVVTSLGGYGAFRVLLRLLPKTAGGVVSASALAGGVSAVLAAMAFSVEWLFGASAPVPFDTVFGAMVGVHALIGVGEGLITAMVMAAVVASRPDVVYGVAGLDPSQLAGPARAGRATASARALVIGGILAAVIAATVVSQFAGASPDGLERVAGDTGFAEAAGDHALAGGPFADYATQGLGNERLSLAVAGASGVVIVLAVGSGMFAAVRDRRPVVLAAEGRSD